MCFHRSSLKLQEVCVFCGEMTLFFIRLIRFQVMVRLLADNVVPRWTRDARREWAVQRHERATTGVEPLPVGIGLSNFVPKKEE